MYVVGIDDTPHVFREITKDQYPPRLIRIVACECGVGGVRHGRGKKVTISEKFFLEDVWRCPLSVDARLIEIISNARELRHASVVKGGVYQTIIPPYKVYDSLCYWIEVEHRPFALAREQALPLTDLGKVKRIKVLSGSTFGSRANLTHGSQHNVIAPPSGEDQTDGVWVQGVDMPVQVRFGDFAKIWKRKGQ